MEKAIEKGVQSHTLGIKSSQQASRGKYVSVCACACEHDARTARSLSNLKHGTNRVAYGQGKKPTALLLGWGGRGDPPRTLEHAKINYQARQSSIWATMVNSDQEGPPQTIYPPPSKGNSPKRQLGDKHWFELLSKHLFPTTELWSTFSIRSEGTCTPAFLWVIWH